MLAENLAGQRFCLSSSLWRLLLHKIVHPSAVAGSAVSEGAFHLISGAPSSTRGMSASYAKAPSKTAS